MPSAAESTMRARFRRRCSIFDQRAKPFKLSALRCRQKIVAVASGMTFMHP
jgi:hypothetical protein